MTENTNKDILDQDNNSCCGDDAKLNPREISGNQINVVGDLSELFSSVDFAKQAETDHAIRVVLKAFENDLEGKSEDALKHFNFLYDLYIGNNIK